MWSLKSVPNLNFDQVYGTSETASTRALGAYLALPMRVGKPLLTSPAVVLKNESYDMLIGAQSLREYQATGILKEGALSMLGYLIPLIFKEPLKEKGNKICTCILEYPSGIFSLLYWSHKPNPQCPPDAVLEDEVFHLYAQKALYMHFGAQVVVNIQISFDLPFKTFLELYSPAEKTNSKSHLCPGIIDSSHASTLEVLRANLTAVPMKIQKGQLIGYVKFLKASDFSPLHLFGGFDELNLLSDSPVINALFSNADFAYLPAAQKDQALVLID